MYEFGIDFVARCIAASAKEAVSSQLGNTTIKIITKDEYDSITPDSDTIYYVVDGDKIVQYVGDTKLTSGSIAGVSSLTGQSIESIIGIATFDPDAVEEVENT